MFDKIDYKTIRILGREVRLTINHRERSISVRLNDGYPAEFRLTGYISERLALGASVRLEYGGDEDMVAGLYIGPLRMYAGISNRLLSSLLGAVKLGRRVTSMEAELGPRFGDESEGLALRVRGHLWDDDYCNGPKSRSFSVDLLDTLLGKPMTSERTVVDEREVVVPLPEGSFTTRARLVERFVARSGWPFKRFQRWVEFRETPAVVPQKGGGTSFYNMGGPWTGITGNSIDDGVAEFVRRVLEQRSRYGGKAWATKVPAATKTRDSHEVSVWRIVDGKEQEVWRGEILHGQRELIGDAAPSGPVPIEHGGAFPNVGPALVLKRDPQHGGVVLSCGLVLLPGSVTRGSDAIARCGDITLMLQDEIHVRGERFKVYSSPIGPAPTPTRPGSVNAFDILATAKAAGLHGVNGGPAIGRVGRIQLQGMKAAQVLLAVEMDPQWYAGNTDLVAGACAVHPASTFDVETRRWIEPTTAEQLTADFEHASALAENARMLARHDAETDQTFADVEEVLAQLDTTPPGPTEEAEGLAARERATEIAFAMRHTNFDLNTAKSLSPTDIACMREAAAVAFGVDLGKGDSTVLQMVQVDPDGSHQLVGQPVAVSALSAVLGDGQPDLSPAPDPNIAPWLPAGDLMVVVARGEVRQTMRLRAMASARIGAHKDAEIRLLGAHMVSALLEQDLGAVWITRRSDNVAVDLFGLDIGERVRLREGAEVQVGQLYTLTFTSNRGA